MTTAAQRFQPTTGDESEATRVHSLMVATPIDGIITYDDLDRVLGRRFVDHRGPWYDAEKRWNRENVGQGVWINIRTVGFRRASSWKESKAEAHSYRLQAARKVRKARGKAVGAIPVTPQERQEQSDLATRLGYAETAIRNLRQEVQVLKPKVRQVEQAQDETKAELAEVKTELVEFRKTLADLMAERRKGQD